MAISAGPGLCALTSSSQVEPTQQCWCLEGILWAHSLFHLAMPICGAPDVFFKSGKNYTRWNLTVIMLRVRRSGPWCDRIILGLHLDQRATPVPSLSEKYEQEHARAHRSMALIQRAFKGLCRAPLLAKLKVLGYIANHNSLQILYNQGPPL